MPTTSKPRSASNAAVTDESTPPDIATTTRWPAGSPGRSRSGGRLTVAPPAPSARNWPRAARRRRRSAPPQSRHNRQCTARAPLRDRAGRRQDRDRAQTGYRQWSRAPPARSPSSLPPAPSHGNSRYGARSRHRGSRQPGAAPDAFPQAHRICRSPSPRRGRNGSKTDSPAPDTGENMPRAARLPPAEARTDDGYNCASRARMPQPNAGQGPVRRSYAANGGSAEQQVAGRRGQLHRQTVELLGNDDLATEA